ncbi:hypothetical protein [Virgibacillus ainsalahensis]
MNPNPDKKRKKQENKEESLQNFSNEAVRGKPHLDIDRVLDQDIDTNSTKMNNEQK